MGYEYSTEDELELIGLFFGLLKTAGYGWAYALDKSSREWVVCLYKKNGLWHEYMIQDGERIELYPDGIDLYDLCIRNLSSIRDASNYLVSAFEKESGYRNRKNKR